MRHRILTVGRRTVSEVAADRLLRLGAEAAFWSLLSLPPLLLGLLGLVGYVANALGPSAVAQIHDSVIRGAGTVLTPSAVHNVVGPLVDRVFGQGHAEAVSAGFVISFWSGSAAMNAYVDAITVAYDMEQLRSAWRTRALALAIYLVALAIGAVLLPILVLGPGTIISLVPGVVTPEVATTVHVFYWPVLVAMCLVALATMYKVSVPVRAPWLRGLPGAALAMVLWIGGALGVRAYLGSALHKGSSYGSLAAPIAALLFFYVTALAVLIGAELNSEIDDMWPTTATAEGRRQSSEVRGAQLAELEGGGDGRGRDGGGDRGGDREARRASGRG